MNIFGSLFSSANDKLQKHWLMIIKELDSFLFLHDSGRGSSKDKRNPVGPASVRTVTITTGPTSKENVGSCRFAGPGQEAHWPRPLPGERPGPSGRGDAAAEI